MKEEYIETKFGRMFYKVLNEDKTNLLVFLHGWGMDSKTFDGLVSNFNNYKILVVDFLGFGKSDFPNKPLSLDDYVNTLKEVLNEITNDLNKVYIIGHSFGGRVGIRFSKLYNIKGLFLINAKALKNKSLKLKLKIIRYKLTKFFLRILSKKKYENYIKDKGSNDYKKLNDVMKKTFVRIVNFDLLKTLKQIKCRVVVMGSVYDDIVLFEETTKIYQNTLNSSIYTFYNSKHFSYLDEENKVVGIIRKELAKCK